MKIEMDKELKITDRQVTHLLEEVSRVKRQVDLIFAGKTHTDSGKHRLDIIREVALEIDKILILL